MGKDHLGKATRSDHVGFRELAKSSKKIKTTTATTTVKKISTKVTGKLMFSEVRQI